MKSSLLRNLMGYRNLSRDQIGIRLALVIGISGQLVVFLIPDPLWILAPQIPMLSSQHWPGSQINTELFLTDGWQPWGSSDPYRPYGWEEKRGFYQSLFLS